MAGEILLGPNGERKLDSLGRIILKDSLGTTCCCGQTYLQCRKCCDNTLTDLWLLASILPPTLAFKYKGLCYYRDGGDPSSTDPNGKTVVSGDISQVDNCGVSRCDPTTGFHVRITGVTACNGCWNGPPGVNNSVRYEGIISAADEDLLPDGLGSFVSGTIGTLLTTSYPVNRDCVGMQEGPFPSPYRISFNPASRVLSAFIFGATLPVAPNCATPSVTVSSANNQPCPTGFANGGTAVVEYGTYGTLP